MRIQAWFLMALILLMPGEGLAETVRIGMSLGLTGKYAPLAEMQKRAFRLWEQEANEKGGILGKEVRMFIHDDQSTGDVAKKLYLKMITEERMDFLFPPYSSGLTAAILPITEKYGYPLLASGASADSIWKQGYKNIFGVYSSASRYTLGFIEMALAYNLTRLAIISADDPFSRNLAVGTEKWARRLGINVVVNLTFKKGTADLTAEAESAKSADSQTIIMCGHFDEAVNMRRALKQIGWYPQAYYASVGPVLPKYYEALGVDAENTFSSTQWMYYKKLPFPGSEAFYTKFMKKYGVAPSYQAAAAYASGVLLSSAIERAGSFERSKVRDAMASMDMMTLLGRYGVDRTGMQIRHFAMIIQWINGTKQAVWPSELSTAAPQFP